MSGIRKVTVVGLGYIGLPTAAALATRGVQVCGVDVDALVVEAVNRGEVHFVEPDLAVAVSGAVTMGNLRASTTVSEADAFVIAVPTPFTEVGHEADLSFVRAAAEAIAPCLKPGDVVILESTSPPGSTRQVSEWIQAVRPDLQMPHNDRQAPNIHVAHCPERVLPGRIMIEIVTNDRVIGGLTEACAERAADVYRVFCQGELALTDAASAEMSKLAENAYRDVNIAFANELSLICDRLRLDVWEVIEMANRHPRVGILKPGPGVGGHCIAVDPWFIVAAAPEEARMIRAAREINDAKPHRVVGQVVARAERMVNPTVACLGLAFKANVDDLRQSPAVEITALLADQLPDVKILVVEPHISVLPAALQDKGNVSLEGMAEAVEQADILLVLVDHRAFKSVKRTALDGKVVFDTRGIWR